MLIHAFGSAPHYVDHLYPVWTDLGHYRGAIWAGCETNYVEAQKVSLLPRNFIPWVRQQNPEHWFLVASCADASTLFTAGLRNIILMEHGIGQTYANVRNGSYIGAERDNYVKRYWMPNSIAQERQQSFTKRPVDLLKPYRVERLRTIPRKTGDKPRVVISFHADYKICPETRGTWKEWDSNGGLKALLNMADIDIYGHAHPTAKSQINLLWQKLRVPIIESFDEVISTASVYVVDNSSTLYEAAACGIPVLVLNGGYYRPAIRHGLRFWDFADVGLEVWAKNPQVESVFPKALRHTLTDDPKKSRREEITQILFGHQEFSAYDLAEKIFGGESKSVVVTADIPKKSQEQIETPKEPVKMYDYAISVKDQSLPYEGEIKKGQKFRPGWRHTQISGEAVPTSQSHHNPRARLSLLVNSKLAIPYEDENSPVIPKIGEIAIPQSDDSSVELEKPLKKRGRNHGSNPNSNTRPQHDDSERFEGMAATEH